jgi:hypothetical protein
MEDQGGHHTCPEGNDRASPSIRDNAKRKNRQNGQQGNFDEGFHSQKYAPVLACFPAFGSVFARISGRSTGQPAQRKSPGAMPRGFDDSREVAKDQYFEMPGPPKR